MSPRALVIFLENVHDQEILAAYRKEVGATLAPFNGVFLVRGGAFDVIEGDWAYARTVIIEFPSRAQAEGWYRSSSYQKILPLRLMCMSSNAIIIDAVS